MVSFVALACAASAQEIAIEDDLATENTSIITRVDAFGQEIQVAEGQIVNNGSAAYTGLSVTAEVYDADGELIGEGFGFLVNACGAALVDLTLQPGEARPFAVTLEMFEDGAEIDRVDIIPQGDASEAVETGVPQVLNAVTPVTRQEVVAVEWIDDEFLRFGVGCAGDVFTAQTWYEYDLVTGTQTEIAHPDAELVTDALLQQLGLTDPALFNRSHLSFPPDARRLVYQNDLNHIITAELDGSFKRVIYDELRHTLQGFIWLGEGRFLAYYFGASGEPVRYFTADVEGQPISDSIDSVPPSVTVPGATPDGLRVVIGGAFEDKTGYFLRSTVFESNELLFEAELPGNNWPAPVYSARVDGSVYIFIARPVDGQARLQCFDVQARELHDLTPLPLQLATEDRAWMWLSPDGATLALAANGVNGGLWLVNLSGFMACAPE